ncbi:MAG: hypothetical protein N2167_00950 [Flavobacteriales bacterium]|nr:hypothetical protein [Flavobacteriales bacterium]
MQKNYFLIIVFNLLIISFLSCKNKTRLSLEKNVYLNLDTQTVDWNKDTFRITEQVDVEANVYYEMFSNPTFPVQDTVNLKVLYILNSAFSHILDSSHINIKTYEDLKEA